MSDVESASSDSEESVSPPISERATSPRPAAEEQPSSDHEESQETSADDEKPPPSLSGCEPQPTKGKVQLRETHGIHVAWPEPPHQAEEPTNANDDSSDAKDESEDAQKDTENTKEETSDDKEVAFDFVVVPGVEGNWETASPWISKSYEVEKNRILRFEYPTQGFYSGSKCRDSIRNTALRLLRGVSALRQGESKKRVIVFVAHDLGAIIVKDVRTFFTLLA